MSRRGIKSIGPLAHPLTLWALHYLGGQFELHAVPVLGLAVVASDDGEDPDTDLDYLVHDPTLDMPVLREEYDETAAYMRYTVTVLPTGQRPDDHEVDEAAKLLTARALEHHMLIARRRAEQAGVAA